MNKQYVIDAKRGYYGGYYGGTNNFYVVIENDLACSILAKDNSELLMDYNADHIRELINDGCALSFETMIDMKACLLKLELDKTL